MKKYTAYKKFQIKEKYSYGYALQKYKPFKKEEEKFNLKLEEDEYYIVRFDGRDMTKDYKIKKEPINIQFFNTMKNAFVEFCNSKKGILFAYFFSDEISILIKGSKDSIKVENRIEKILSLYSSELSIIFYKNALKNNLSLKKDSIFDARILKTNSICEYFIARQAFAIDKYIMQLKGKYEINYKFDTSKKVLQELEKKNIKYTEFPSEYRYGLVYHPKENLTSFEFQSNMPKLKQLLNVKRKKIKTT